MAALKPCCLERLDGLSLSYPLRPGPITGINGRVFQTGSSVPLRRRPSHLSCGLTAWQDWSNSRLPLLAARGSSLSIWYESLSKNILLPLVPKGGVEPACSSQAWLALRQVWPCGQRIAKLLLCILSCSSSWACVSSWY